MDPVNGDRAPEAAGEEFRIGPHVKSLRRQRGWTLDEAAGRTGLSRAAISRIERGEMSPTFDTMKKLARGFAIDLAELFAAPRPASASGRRCITRSGEGTATDTPNYGLQALSTELASKAMQPFVTVVRARSVDEYADWDRHESEDFMYVLEGRLRFYSEHYEPVELGPGDSIYYDGRLGHACVSLSRRDAVILWVTTG